jgi:transposase
VKNASSNIQKASVEAEPIQAVSIEDASTFENLLALTKLLEESNKSKDSQIKALDSQVEDLKKSNEDLWSLIANLRKHIFGKRSEKLSADNDRQGLLFPEDEATAPLEVVEEREVKAHKRVKRTRRGLPEDLPSERREYEPEDKTCAYCGTEKAKIGEEITKELEYIPARFCVIEHVKIKRACSKCKDGVVTGKLPAGTQLISGSQVGVGLLSHILLSKYADHLPLNRQEVIFQRYGIDIPKQRMSDWIGMISERYLMPIAQALRKEILKSNYIKADETSLKIKDVDKKGWLWGMLSKEGDLFFDYNLSRSGETALDLFKISETEQYEGFVQTDLYAGYNKVFLPEKTKRVGCWAHARRKFLEVRELSKKDCDVVLKAISQLYKIERSGTRDKHSRAVIDKLKIFLLDMNEKVLPKSKLKNAISYILVQWDALTLFLDYPELKLDNNAIERQIRPIAVGRHNWPLGL